jgi:hypothetical protein
MAKKPPVKTIKPTPEEYLGFQVQIKCTGADEVEIDQLQNFQGNLKKLSDESYERLKKSIMDLGFSFPVAAWKDRTKIFILDAHQRVDTLKRMRAEGFIVPKLPVVWVEAADKTEAAKKLLAATSQYGEIQVDALHSFMEEFKLGIHDVETSFKFPEVDFDSFKLTFYPEIAIVSEPQIDTSPYVQNTEVGVFAPAPKTPGFILSDVPPPTEEQWKGMPEYKQDDKMPHRTVLVHFVDKAGAAAFFERIGQKDTGITKTIWYPPQERMDTESKRYGN